MRPSPDAPRDAEAESLQDTAAHSDGPASPDVVEPADETAGAAAVRDTDAAEPPLEVGEAGLLTVEATSPPDEGAGGGPGEVVAGAFPVSSQGLREVARWTPHDDAAAQRRAREEGRSLATVEALPSGGRLEDVLQGERLTPVDLVGWTSADNAHGDRVVVAVFGWSEHAEWRARHEAAGDLEEAERRIESAIERCVQEWEAHPRSDDPMEFDNRRDACTDETTPGSALLPLHAARVSVPKDGTPTLDAEVEIGRTFYADTYPHYVVRSIEIDDLDQDRSAEAAITFGETTASYSPCGNDVTTSLVVFDLETFLRQVMVRLGQLCGCYVPEIASLHAFQDADGSGTTDLTIRWAYHLPSCGLDERGWPVGHPVATVEDIDMAHGYGPAGAPGCGSADPPEAGCRPCVYLVERRELLYVPESDVWDAADGEPVLWSKFLFFPQCGT